MYFGPSHVYHHITPFRFTLLSPYFLLPECPVKLKIFIESDKKFSPKYLFNNLRSKFGKTNENATFHKHEQRLKLKNFQSSFFLIQLNFKRAAYILIIKK